ncbi:MAG: type IV pilin protein [Paraglaciecola sp.]|uniref:type IV pilin protein n=1 Tax=Paraglaciecola sp. TaxID=1920173 RepID=UPI00273D50DF|nr:type IV pilin protein [Paraglaciecola sp.]MDP5031478.1 type IV pilin protein [Paraglaciecola sp.]MDP5041179.1 type IV pilin protein [Paraglaciecola sp.]MDP5130823.1 type IV pilin protein [Paraglaciecola sp.]
MYSNKKNKSAGFTLVELMIVVAIVGIISMLAYPSYQGFIKSSNRSAAQADLMSLAAAMERHKAASYSYKKAAVSGADTGSPANFHKHSPSAEPYANRKYDLLISQATGSTYLIEAKPSSSSAQAGDGSLFFYSDGRRAWDKDNSGAISGAEYCWSC